MSTKKKANKTRQPPATTPEAREQQLIALAMDLAEERLLDGTATSQEVTHFLKLGTTMEQLEKRKKEHEVELLKAKSEQIKSAERVEELYDKALAAMTKYQGGEDEDDESRELYDDHA